jgi:hypothetical protein|nr:hypothetical protein [Kofleriaceae bacterium]
MRTTLAITAAIVAVPLVAHANPRPLPMTYTTDTLPEGGVEVEQFADLVPLRSSNLNGNEQRYLASQFQTEIEIGIQDRLELGLYFTMTPDLASTINPQLAAKMPEGNGLKQRLRYIFADPGEWPIDVGVYGEVTENETEIELEGKILLQRRFDRLRIAANLVSEYEFYFDNSREVVLNPSAGATYEVTPSFHVGVDSWMRGEYPSTSPPRTFGLGPAYYVGPAVMYNFGRIWWSVGAYVRVSDIDHEVHDGEVYGPLWFRSMIGYDLK